MEPNIYKYLLRNFILSLKENERDLQQKLSFADPEEKDYIHGRIFSYQEVREILKAEAMDYEIDLHQLGL